MIYYITIGNSDNKLTQLAWWSYCHDVDKVARHYASAVHGEWYSEPSTRWQNACWCVEIYQPKLVPMLKDELIVIAETYEQDSIAWAEVATLEFLRPGT